MTNRSAVLLASLALALPMAIPAHAADDGFAAFWTAFTAAVAKNDEAAVEKLSKVEGGGAFATLYHRHFTAAVRQCLVKARPARLAHDGLVTYTAICGGTPFSFDNGETGKGPFRLTDVGGGSGD